MSFFRKKRAYKPSKLRQEIVPSPEPEAESVESASTPTTSSKVNTPNTVFSYINTSKNNSATNTAATTPTITVTRKPVPESIIARKPVPKSAAALFAMASDINKSDNKVSANTTATTPPTSFPKSPEYYEDYGPSYSFSNSSTTARAKMGNMDTTTNLAMIETAAEAARAAIVPANTTFARSPEYYEDGPFFGVQPSIPTPQELVIAKTSRQQFFPPPAPNHGRNGPLAPQTFRTLNARLKKYGLRMRRLVNGRDDGDDFVAAGSKDICEYKVVGLDGEDQKWVDAQLAVASEDDKMERREREMEEAEEARLKLQGVEMVEEGDSCGSAGEDGGDEEMRGAAGAGLGAEDSKGKGKGKEEKKKGKGKDRESSGPPMGVFYE